MYSNKQSEYIKDRPAISSIASGQPSQANKLGDKSPVEVQLGRLDRLLAENDQAAINMIDPLKPILSRDPREIPEAEASASPPSTCELENKLMSACERLEGTINLWGQIRQSICL